MKSFIINTAKEAVTSFKKNEVRGKLMGREWRMLTDDRAITGKYIFLKDGKLLMSVNGLSTYSTWQMATESSLIMDEGVATFLYKVVHIDENLVVLNLDGTDNYCFLINEASQILAKASLEDIQWYLYRNSYVDILSEEQKELNHSSIYGNGNTKDLTRQNKNDGSDGIYYFIAVVLAVLVILVIYSVSVNT